METFDFIEGGYVLLARQLLDSRIMDKSSEYTKVWVYILLKCNHKTVKIKGQIFKRGECLIRSGELETLLSYKKGFITVVYDKYYIHRLYDFMREEKMIATRKTTRGMFVTALNYDSYQNPKNYERNNEFGVHATDAQHDKQEQYKNDKQEISSMGAFEKISKLKPEEIIKGME